MKKLFTLLAGFLLLASCSNNSTQTEQATAKATVAEARTERRGTPVDFSEFKTIKLLAPDTLNQIPLMTALKERRSSREFNEKMLSLEDLSNIFWACNGINHIDGRRTAPSAYACYPIRVYAAFPTGIYLYDANTDELQPVVKGDYRALCGTQEFVPIAPMNIIYVADMSKYINFSFLPDDVLTNYAVADAAHCSQNVYLCCAIYDINVVIRATGIDEENILKTLKLDKKQFQVFLSQTVGYKPENDHFNDMGH